MNAVNREILAFAILRRSNICYAADALALESPLGDSAVPADACALNVSSLFTRS